MEFRCMSFIFCEILRALHLVNFTDGTVSQTFFNTLADIVQIVEATSNFQGMSVKNYYLLRIKEIVRIYANFKYLAINVRWVFFILAEYSL